MKDGQEEADKDQPEKDSRKRPRASSQGEGESKSDVPKKATSEVPVAKEKPGGDADEEASGKSKVLQHPIKKEKEGASGTTGLDMDSDSERELVIDLGDDQTSQEHKQNKKEPTAATTPKDPVVPKTEGERLFVQM